MPGMPLADAEQNGTKAYPIIAASGVWRLGAPGAAPPSDASAGVLLRDAPAALVGRQAPNEERTCRQGIWHQRGAAAGVQPLQGAGVGDCQELQVVGELFDGPCAAALHPPFVGEPVDVWHEERRAPLRPHIEAFWQVVAAVLLVDDLKRRRDLQRRGCKGPRAVSMMRTTPNQPRPPDQSAAAVYADPVDAPSWPWPPRATESCRVRRHRRPFPSCRSPAPRRTSSPRFGAGAQSDCSAAPGRSPTFRHSRRPVRAALGREAAALPAGASP